MAWRNGRSVAADDRTESGRRRFSLSGDASPKTRLPRVLLPANKPGRSRIQDGFFDSSTLQDKIAPGALTNAVVSVLFSVGSFAANAATRALFASGFVASDLIAPGAVTKTKLADGFMKQAVLTGAAAGSFKLTGINVGDALVYVYEQNGTSGLITDRTSEFKIQSKDYISNVGGTSTAGDKLLVLYLDLT